MMNDLIDRLEREAEITCYASTAKEYRPNQTAKLLREAAGILREPVSKAADAVKTLERIAHVLNTCEVRWKGDTVLDYISALVTAGLTRIR